jgi:hypothetical protein
MGPKNITKMWKDHFQTLLNSSSDISKKNSVKQRLKTVYYIERFNANEVNEAIRTLKKNKSSGADGLNSEHYIYASEKMHVFLCMLLIAL